MAASTIKGGAGSSRKALLSSARLPPPAHMLEQLLAEQARRAAEAARRQLADDAEIIRERCESLAGFVREAWHVLEPGNVYVHGWHIEAICAHLEAVSDGRITRLLINVPPGTMKVADRVGVLAGVGVGPDGAALASLSHHLVFRDIRQARLSSHARSRLERVVPKPMAGDRAAPRRRAELREYQARWSRGNALRQPHRRPRRPRDHRPPAFDRDGRERGRAGPHDAHLSRVRTDPPHRAHAIGNRGHHAAFK